MLSPAGEKFPLHERLEEFRVATRGPARVAPEVDHHLGLLNDRNEVHVVVRRPCEKDGRERTPDVVEVVLLVVVLGKFVGLRQPTGEELVDARREHAGLGLLVDRVNLGGTEAQKLARQLQVPGSEIVHDLAANKFRKSLALLLVQTTVGHSRRYTGSFDSPAARATRSLFAPRSALYAQASRRVHQGAFINPSSEVIR